MRLFSLKLSAPFIAFTCLTTVRVSYGEPYSGYTLFASSNSSQTRLINLSNATVHTWTGTRSGGYSSYLLPNGRLLRTANHNNPTFNAGGGHGYIQEFNWEGTIAWEYLYSNNQHRAHHDLTSLPNGNVLIIAWEYRTAAQAVQAGLDHSAVVWPDHIVEIEPTGSTSGEIVWEWHAWDHLIQDHDQTKDNYGVVADHPELLDINMPGGASGPMGGGDWMHINGIGYSIERDEIVISSHTLDEIYVIDHSTTTEEAAGHTGGNRGHGGDILYRWGKPANYDAAGTAYFYVVHCSVWIPAGMPGAGNILAFNNREGQGTSIVTEITPPYDEDGNYIRTPGSAYAPATPTWTYTATGFYSNHLGSCQRVANGNTVMVESTSGRMLEVDQSGVLQWEYDYSAEVTRAQRYGVDYPGVYELNPVIPGAVVINEFLAVNGSNESDQDGEFDPWIELYNTTDNAVSLWGFTLSDDSDDPTKWTFPDTSISANSYLIVWADEDTEQAGLHLNWAPAAGGLISFHAPDRNILDQVSYSNQTVDTSYGRYPNGTGEFLLMPPTCAAENDSFEISEAVDPVVIPLQTELAQNYPNPFNSTTTFSFQIAKSSHVGLDIYNIAGERIATILSSELPAGDYRVEWDGTDDQRRGIASGVYFYRLNAGAFHQTRKLVFLK